MARTSWFDDTAKHPVIQEKVEKLESFTSALADGVVEKSELAGQEQRLVAAMKQLEPLLTDEQRWALVEYLKSIPEEAGRVTPFGGPPSAVTGNAPWGNVAK